MCVCLCVCVCRQEDLVNLGGILWLDDLHCPSEKLFYMDRKSDPANWEYKSLYRAHITRYTCLSLYLSVCYRVRCFMFCLHSRTHAHTVDSLSSNNSAVPHVSILYLCRYKRKGSSALGLDSRTQGVCWEDSAIDRKRKEKRDERYFSPSNRRLFSAEAPPTLSAPHTDSTQSTDPASFIPLPLCKEESDSTPQTGSSTDPLRVYDSATVLWLEGKGQPEVKSQPPLSLSNIVTSRVEEFNRKLRENPTDINMWLEFIQFQVDFC